MNRRELLGLDGGACRVTPVPNVVVTTHEGRRALFHDDLVRGKVVLVQFASLADDAGYPVLENVARVQTLLGDRLGRDVHICTITTDPHGDTPRELSDAMQRLGAKPGWWFLTGEAAALAALKAHFFAHGHVHDGEDCSRGVMRYGNPAAGLWGSVPAKAEPDWIAERLTWLAARDRPSGAPRRRGPAALATLLVALLPLTARADTHSGHPY
ncbi:MAG TPA: SCO family protein, partial [Tahibacter sp.]|nr:SCO family protein [Tahibacter sp.]